MNFEHWLIQIGKSNRKATSYSGAISRTNPDWADVAGLVKQPLINIQSVRQFNKVAEQIKMLAIFQEIIVI